jgi:hypothetical protein
MEVFSTIMVFNVFPSLIKDQFGIFDLFSMTIAAAKGRCISFWVTTRKMREREL